MLPIDILGKKIKVGDRIAYATRYGNSGKLQVGVVIDIDVAPDSIFDIKVQGDSNSKAGWTSSDKVLVINSE